MDSFDVSCDTRVVAHQRRKPFETVDVWNQDHELEESGLCHCGKQLAGQTDILERLQLKAVNDVLQDFIGQFGDSWNGSRLHLDEMLLGQCSTGRKIKQGSRRVGRTFRGLFDGHAQVRIGSAGPEGTVVESGEPCEGAEV